MKVYKSKIDSGLVILVLSLTLVPIVPVLLVDKDIIVIGLVISVAIFEIITFMGFKYIIDGTTLTVSMLYVMRETYDIGDIVEVKSTNTILASPAASMDRLAISFKNRRSPLVISPKDKHAFVRELTLINPHIRTKL